MPNNSYREPKFRKALPWILFIAVLLTTAYPVLAGDPSGVKALKAEMTSSAKKISKTLKGNICVMDFAESGEKVYTSEFGQLVANLLSDKLTERSGKYSVLSRREIVKIMQDSIIFGTASVIDKLQKEAGMDCLVSGEYTMLGDQIILSIRAVEASSGKILASTTLTIDKTRDMEKMAANRFRQALGQGKEEKPANIPVELETGVFFEGADGKLYPLREGMVMDSNDNYAIYLKLPKDTYVYVFQADSSNKLYRIFPSAEFSEATNPLRGGTEYWLPDNGKYLYLDTNPGKEEIYVFASSVPQEKLASLDLKQYQSGRDFPMELMSVGGVRESVITARIKGIKSGTMQQAVRHIAAEGGFCYRLSFIHR